MYYCSLLEDCVVSVIIGVVCCASHASADLDSQGRDWHARCQPLTGAYGGCRRGEAIKEAIKRERDVLCLTPACWQRFPLQDCPLALDEKYQERDRKHGSHPCTHYWFSSTGVSALRWPHVQILINCYQPLNIQIDIMNDVSYFLNKHQVLN